MVLFCCVTKLGVRTAIYERDGICLPKMTQAMLLILTALTREWRAVHCVYLDNGFENISSATHTLSDDAVEVRVFIADIHIYRKSLMLFQLFA
jgi:hypothetical protein